jgi:hypothetical protein
MVDDSLLCVRPLGADDAGGHRNGGGFPAPFLLLVVGSDEREERERRRRVAQHEAAIAGARDPHEAVRFAKIASPMSSGQRRMRASYVGRDGSLPFKSPCSDGCEIPR